MKSHSNVADQVKIWFDDDGSIPLGGIINELRLIRHQKNNTGKLTLISNYCMWQNESGKKMIINFCKKYNIELVSVTEFEQKLRELVPEDIGIQLQLMYIAKRELNDYTYGNLAAVSDIIRVLSPTFIYGQMYTDLDIEVTNCLKRVKTDENSEIILRMTEETLCNDLIYSTNPDNIILQEIRKKILERYNNLLLFSFFPKEIVYYFELYEDDYPGIIYALTKFMTAGTQSYVDNYCRYDAYGHMCIFRKRLSQIPDNMQFFERGVLEELVNSCTQALICYTSGPKMLRQVINEWGVEYLACKENLDPSKISKVIDSMHSILAPEIAYESVDSQDASWLPWGIDNKREEDFQVRRLAGSIKRLWGMKAKNRLK